jgi:hypothetical protein
VTRVGDGVVVSKPPGIACGDLDHCQKAWAANQKVTLTAHPTPDTTFQGWGGACAGNDTCVVEVPAPDAVTARFAQTGSTCATVPTLNASLTIRAVRRPRRLNVVLQPAVASTARLRVGRPGLSFVDRTAKLAAARNVITLPIPRTVKAAVYLMTIDLSDSCGRTSTLRPLRVVVPRAGRERLAESEAQPGARPAHEPDRQDRRRRRRDRRGRGARLPLLPGLRPTHACPEATEGQFATSRSRAGATPTTSAKPGSTPQAGRRHSWRPGGLSSTTT